MYKFSAQYCSSRKEKDSSGVVALECKPAEKGEQCAITANSYPQVTY